MSLHPRTGNGDPCAQDPEHGRMWVFQSKRQWCPNVAHKGTALYEYDGVTPVRLTGAETPAAVLAQKRQPVYPSSPAATPAPGLSE